MINATISLIRNKIIVGSCKLEIENDECFLTKVKIFNKFRGRGYCVLLVNKAINFAKKRNLKYIFLFVNHENIAALKCYKKNGFKIIKDSADGYKMKKII